MSKFRNNRTNRPGRSIPEKAFNQTYLSKYTKKIKIKNKISKQSRIKNRKY